MSPALVFTIILKLGHQGHSALSLGTVLNTVYAPWYNILLSSHVEQVCIFPAASHHVTFLPFAV